MAQGNQLNRLDFFDYLVPQVTAPASGGWPVGSLSDYMGIPTGVNNLSTSALWHRAYNLIWNEWFRGENLQDSAIVPTGDGPDVSTTYNLLRRNKKADYFTSALPWPQKGSSVSIPLGTQAPITGLGTADGTYTPSTGTIRQTSGTTLPSNTPYTTALRALVTGTNPNVTPSIYADLSAATAATINQLRQAFQIQKLLERYARGGTRYTEILQSHFGVVSPDARLQRPEYLGGGFTKSFVEHGVILGLVSIRADLNYQQGLHRMFPSHDTRF